MAKITINKEMCKGCELCSVNCPQKIIVMDEVLNIRGVKPARFLDNDKCTACRSCAIMCPDVCIEVYK
ncbi:MAG: 4Fe-4S binding protein [Candidatus Omnitrophota bacterium]